MAFSDTISKSRIALFWGDFNTFSCEKFVQTSLLKSFSDHGGFWDELWTFSWYSIHALLYIIFFFSRWQSLRQAQKTGYISCWHLVEPSLYTCECCMWLKHTNDQSITVLKIWKRFSSLHPLSSMHAFNHCCLSALLSISIIRPQNLFPKMC